MSRKRKRRGITPWKKTALKVCVLWLIAAAWIHVFREWKIRGFDDQREASRWGSAENCAQVSAFLPSDEALKEENIQELEYKINSSLAQDSIKLTADGPDAKLWQDCYSGIGTLTLAAGSKSVTVEAVGTGGAFFTFHPLKLSGGTYYLPDSAMQDEIILDEETAWKLFGSFDVEGRTVRVQNMYLRISGVYKKGEGSLYEEGGLSDYVVFVQYKTLLQYGGTGGGSGNEGQTTLPGTASSPAATRSSIYLSSSTPFVVSVTCSVPGISLSLFTKSGQPTLTRGSPPVTLNFVIPMRDAAVQIRSMSSYERISLCETLSQPSGMQYLHLRLHLSVIDTRIYSILRPYLSFMFIYRL